MKVDQVLYISDWAAETANKLVPRSSNKKPRSWRKSLFVNMNRRRVPRKLKKQIKSWNIDVSIPEEESHHPILNPDNEQATTTTNFIRYIKNTFFQKTVRRYHRDNRRQITSTEFLEHNARKAVEAGVGNCGELSNIAFCLLAEYTKNLLKEFLNDDETPPIVESFKLGGETDHCFIVIGRDPESNIYDMHTWGENAIICDPWGNLSCIVASELNYMYDEDCSTYKMFEYIYNALIKERCPVTISAKTTIGQGHSQRWQDKKRNNLTDIFFSKMRDKRTLESVPYVIEAKEESNERDKKRRRL